jgi:hypothetical protein
MPYFTLYSRTWCHLCEDMLHALRALVGDTMRIDVVDVDADPALVEKYDELVPVLIGHQTGHAPEQLCNYYLSDNVVSEFLARCAVNSGLLPTESGKMRD